MYSFKEKKKHFNALLNPDAAKYDLDKSNLIFR